MYLVGALTRAPGWGRPGGTGAIGASARSKKKAFASKLFFMSFLRFFWLFPAQDDSLEGCVLVFRRESSSKGAGSPWRRQLDVLFFYV